MLLATWAVSGLVVAKGVVASSGSRADRSPFPGPGFGANEVKDPILVKVVTVLEVPAACSARHHAI